MLQISTLLLRASCRFSVKKFRILRQIVLISRQIRLFWGKISKFYGITNIIFNYSAPYCRESKSPRPTSRVIGTLKYAPAAEGEGLVENWSVT